jgi:hypothetical protein
LKATKRIRETTVRQTKGSIISINLKLSWDTKAIPAEMQKEIWERLGGLLAAVMPTTEERTEFLEELSTSLKSKSKGA